MAKGPKIAFFGLGVMGSPMGRNIAAAGFDIRFYDANQQTLDAFRKDGLQCGSTPAETAMDCTMIITVLPNSAIVDEVLFGDGGAVSASSPNALVIEMSTGSPRYLPDLLARLEAAGHRLIDAPVGRSRREAVTGKLLIMAGGSKDDLEEARPVLNEMGDMIVHAGPVGSGLKLKLVNNYMAMANHVLTGEVLAFAERAGLDLGLTVEVLSTTSAGRGQLNTNFPKKVLAGDVTPDFSIAMGIKDLSMALELTEDTGSSSSFGELSRDWLGEAEDDGMGGNDCTAILNFFERRKV